MSEKDRNKAGLHRKISSIFSGVAVPKSNNRRKTSDNTGPEDTDYNKSELHVPESQEYEPLKPDQPAETLPKDESSTESKADPTNESNSVAAQDSEVVPIEQSDDDSAQQSNEKSASPPKFLTAQDSKDIPIEQFDVDSDQQPDEKSVKPSAFVTARGTKVIPILESDVDPAEKSKTEPVQQSKVEPAHKPDPETANQNKNADTKKPKVEPVKQPKANIGNVAKKKTKVKVREQNFWNQITAKLFTPKPGVSPTKQKVIVVLIPVLFVFLLIFIVRGGVLGTSVNNAGHENSVSSAASTALSTQIDWKIPEPYPATLRDPMRLGPVERETNQDGSGRFAKLKVKGILVSEDGSSSAIIGNRILHEGEKIQGVNIIKINKDNVEFEVNGETWTQEVQG